MSPPPSRPAFVAPAARACPAAAPPRRRRATCMLSAGEPRASGPVPPSASRARRRALRDRLAAAVAQQRFADAAALRDELAAADAADPGPAADADAVLDACDAFYDAVRAADANAMHDVWLPADEVSCAMPGRGLVCGAEAVVAAWRVLFARGPRTDIHVQELSVNVKKNLAWVIARQEGKPERGWEGVGGVRIATNVLQKRRGRWWLVHHHASPLVEGGEEPT